MNIRPSAVIRNNYNDISNFCKTTGEPVYLTKNGEGDLVVMDIEYFEKTMGKLFEAGMLKDGLTALANGDVVDGDSVRRQMTEKYGL